MEYILSVVFGVVQGVTEFLPISSSGHLLILHEFVSLDLQNELAFDVALHTATMLAVVLFFASDLWRYLRAWLQSFQKPDLKGDVDQRLAWYLILGTIPAGVVGYFFESAIEDVFRSNVVVIVMLIVVAILFLVVERAERARSDMSSMTVLDTIIIGIAQAVALIPGTSRSGITIIAGMSRGLKRSAAARFSFLLSVPIIVGAGLKQISELESTGGIPSFEIGVYILGFVSAFVTGFFAIRFFLRFVEHHSLKSFAIYRLVLAVVFALILYAR